MSRRTEYERVDDRQTDYSRRGGRERDYNEEVDYRSSSRYDGPGPSRRTETVVKEREDDTVVSRSRRGPRQPDFLREDYGRSENAGQLVVREESRQEDDYITRVPSRRRSMESVRSRRPAQTERVEEEKTTIRETERGGPPYPRGSFTEKEEIIYRDQVRQPRPSREVEEIDIRIRDRESDRRPPPREYRVQDDEEIVYRQGRPSRTVVEDKEEITFRERSRSRPPARTEVVEDITFRERSRSRPATVRTEVVEKEDITWREREPSRPPPVRREVEEITIKEREREPRWGREVRKEDVDIDIKERDSWRGGRDVRKSDINIDIKDREREGWRGRDVQKEDIDINIRERDREGWRGRDVQKEDININIRDTEREGWGGRDVQKEDININIRETEREGGRGRDAEKEEIDINIRDRSAPPIQRELSRGALVRRDREEWIVRRRRTPSPSPSPPPPPVREVEKTEITIQRKEPSPEPEPPREPTPEPLPIYRPPIIQEYITHHRTIDHGVERVREPTPPPPTPPPPDEEDLEIKVKRTGTRNGKAFEEEIVIDQETLDRKGRGREEVVEKEEIRRSVSASTRPEREIRRFEDDTGFEADYYNRRISSRAYPGEAWDGATKHWGLVDVPPGTERVRMDGIGGGAQEITWERYNGERHGKFINNDRVYDSGYGNGFRSPAPLPPPEPRRDDFRESRVTETRIERETTHGRTRDRKWTEITKDLVIEEAIKEQGYEYEESGGYYYVMEYLRYEDVLKLVEISEDIRRQRRERIREIQWQSEERERVPKMLPPPMPAPPRRGYYDERSYYERDVVYDRDGRRYRRY